MTTHATPSTLTVLDHLEAALLPSAEDDDQRRFLQETRKADVQARAILALTSPLEDGARIIQATRTLVCGERNRDNPAADIIAGQYGNDAVTDGCLYASITAAYRLGIAVGLRLADLTPDGEAR